MQRNTVQRQIVLDVLMKLNNHPTIDEIYAEVNKDHPSVSKTTVYRNLRQLAQNGVIRLVTMLGGLERYEMLSDKHHHFKCKTCGNLLDVDIGYQNSIDETARQKYGLQVDEHDIVLKGACSKCKNLTNEGVN